MEGDSGGCENDCQDDCNEEDHLQICKCIRVAEHASRFTLRLLEALRSLKYEKQPGEVLSSSTVEEIVGYFEKNYRDVGDLRAQVETGLRQICSQGLAMELFQQEYYFVGPHANSMNTSTGNSCEKRTQCLASSSFKSLQDCTAISCKNQQSKNVSKECSRRAANASRKEGKSISGSNSSSGCSQCSAKGASRSVIADKSTLEYREAEKNASAKAHSQYRKCKSSKDHTQGNPAKRKKNNPRGRRRSSSGKRCSALNGEVTKDLHDDDDDENDDALSGETEEIYQTTRDQEQPQQSKTREQELKSWIKRCRTACRDRRKH